MSCNWYMFSGNEGHASLMGKPGCNPLGQRMTLQGGVPILMGGMYELNTFSTWCK